MTPRSLLVDTNLLLLFIVGSLSQRWIAQHRRLQGFGIRDYEKLSRIMMAAQQVVVTPNILTETSNLLGSPKSPSDRPLFEAFASFVGNVEVVEEIYVPSVTIAKTTQMLYLGLTDAGILSLKGQGTVILTRDERLISECLATGLPVLPFDRLGAEV